LNPNLKFRTAKLPQLPKNNPSDPNYSYATYWAHGVADKSKAKEASWTFLKYLARADTLKELNENIIKSETIGKVYPRPEMNTDMAQDEILGSIITYAYDAKSFYLAHNINDGIGGINSQVNDLYEGVIKEWPNSERTLDNSAQELSQILAKYGVIVR
jgi:ABC-type glycerol-3-phosphate transport system substrate-binding protein